MFDFQNQKENLGSTTLILPNNFEEYHTTKLRQIIIYTHNLQKKKN